VDFTTGGEFEANKATYTAQVALYVEAIEKAANMPARPAAARFGGYDLKGEVLRSGIARYRGGPILQATSNSLSNDVSDSRAA
jgi:hypothetical protein